ncbi:MAG: amidohydrolase family protein [Pirellulales bacterium]|nr:amidohydrolase family protein [Pirellulales bacterium]
MAATLIENARLLRPGNWVRLGSVLVMDGKIAAIDPQKDQTDSLVDRVDAKGALLTPGLIDIHSHGIQHFLYEAEPQQIDRAAAVLPSFGTTCVLPTLYTVMNRSSLGHLERLSEALNQTAGAAMPGFHLEGPFLALPGAGAETVPGDLVLLEELLAATGGRVVAMSVSPDTPNIIPVIERLGEQGIAVFITHTRASVEQTEAAIGAGARHATHFYDVFPLPDETESGARPVGAVETILADPRATVDFICDGVHVDPMAIRAALAAKSWEGIVAITDANIGAGLERGVYQTTCGYAVEVSPSDAARVADKDHPQHGTLAGSSLTMDRAIFNLLNWLDLPPHQVWAMGTTNPASVVHLANKGDLRVGADADLVLWYQGDNRLQAKKTWVAGNCVFDAETQPCTIGERQ